MDPPCLTEVTAKLEIKVFAGTRFRNGVCPICPYCIPDVAGCGSGREDGIYMDFGKLPGFDDTEERGVGMDCRIMRNYIRAEGSFIVSRLHLDEKDVLRHVRLAHEALERGGLSKGCV